MANEPQNYQNHALTPRPFIAVVVLCVLAIALVGVGLVLGGDLGHGILAGATVVVAIAVAALTAKDRISDLCLQDRIIRLEMQVRLAKLGLGSQAEKIALPCLIALRFASDAELPALVEKVLSGSLKTGKEIKQQVKNWQADEKRV